MTQTYPGATPHPPGFDDFLNPKSMLTPGVAGGLTMMITNSLCYQFGLPGNYTGLTIAFLFGLVVFYSSRTRVSHKFLYYILNSLIIFLMALGSNQIGGVAEERIRHVSASFSFSFLSPALASEENGAVNSTGAEPSVDLELLNVTQKVSRRNITRAISAAVDSLKSHSYLAQKTRRKVLDVLSAYAHYSCNLETAASLLIKSEDYSLVLEAVEHITYFLLAIEDVDRFTKFLRFTRWQQESGAQYEDGDEYQDIVDLYHRQIRNFSRFVDAQSETVDRILPIFEEDLTSYQAALLFRRFASSACDNAHEMAFELKITNKQLETWDAFKQSEKPFFNNWFK